MSVFFFQNSAIWTGKLDLFCPGCRDNYGEERAQMNRELNYLFYCLWEMENWISGAADRTRQHDAVMVFITGHL